MNYLAHIFLSGTEEGIMIGNFIGDYVKGNDYNNYPEIIKKGILLHRRIGTFTDKHKIVSQSKSYFSKCYHKYSGIIVDILYDHFLVNSWDFFSPHSLDDFKENIFQSLRRNYSILPERVQFFVPSFIKNDWINVYKSVEGIVMVLNRMSMRTTLPDESEFAREIIRKYYIQLQSEFLTFFPEIIKYMIEKRGITIDLRFDKILR
jgi:acyl carrier protein phosphodiesterase